MKRDKKSQIFAIIFTVLLLCNSIFVPSLAKEVSSVNQEEQTQENSQITSSKSDVEAQGQEATNEQSESVTKEQSDGSEKEQSESVKSEQNDGSEKEQSEGVKSEQSGSSEKEQSDQPASNLENASEQNAKSISEKDEANSSQEEKDSSKTEVKNLEQGSFQVFDEEVAKLIATYDNNQNSNQDGIACINEMQDSYLSKRLIVKGLGEALDFSSCGADVVINGPDEIYILQFSTEEATKQAKLQIDQMSEVKYCEIDGYDCLEELQDKAVVTTETDSIASQQTALSWGVSRIGADQYANHLKSNQNELIVAVVDTGIDIDHPFFSGRLSMNAAYNYVDATKDVEDDQGHGTHVSGIVVDCTPELNIKILPIKCMDSDGYGTYTNIANSIRRAADAGAKVINYSAAGGHSEYKDEAINYAIEKGATVVVAAGNGKKEVVGENVCPSHLEDCIVVASIDNTEKVASTSNYGTTVDLVAPGVDIKSAYLDGTYAFLSGTSMATPHVAAAVAMLKLKDSSLTPSQMEEILEKNAKDLGNTGKDIYYGSGMVDLSSLVTHTVVVDQTAEATCEKAGVVSYCSICGKVFEEIKKLEHSYKTEITKATLSKNGQKKQVCSRCGKPGTSQIIYKPEKITLSTTQYTYAGKARKPYFTVLDSTGKRITTANYTVSYSSGRTNVGTYTATLTFTGSLYSGTVKKTFQIVKANQSITASGCTKAMGSAAFTLQGVKLTTGNGKLSYTSSNKNVATISSSGKVTIKGIGKTTITITAAETANYKKTTKKVTIKVIPKKMKINCLKSNKKKCFTICWSKDKLVTAYQIQYSLKSNFSSATTKTVSGSTYKTISQLKAGKKYYVRLRSYKTVGTEKYYSSWSAAKTVTVRSR